MHDFAEQLRRHDGTADELTWPAGLPRHALACDVLERALRLDGDPADYLDAVRAVRASLDDLPALGVIADRMWDRVPNRGLYPGLINEPSRASLPAWAVATVADPRHFSDAFSDAVTIAGHATCDAARDAVRTVATGADVARIAWRAAIELPRARGLPPHPADEVRARILGEPTDDWLRELEVRAWDAERAWQNHWLASQL